MKKAVWIGVPFVLIIGSLLHFTYDWFDQNVLVGVFSAVNESIWEHLKLLFWPMLIYAVIEWFWYGKERDSFLPIRTLSIVAGLVLITVLYYTYSGILGEHLMWADLLVYLIAVVSAYGMSLWLLHRRQHTSSVSKWLSVIALLVIAVLFAYFTFEPPAIAFFAEP